MKFATGLKYLFSTLFIYLALAAAVIFLSRPLIDMISNLRIIRMIIYVSLLVLIIPLITKIIVDKLPFKPEGLKTEKGIKESLKKEVKLEK